MGRFTARLEARDAARNLWRVYTLEAGRDLFGAWVVEVSYGRIGRPGRTLVRGGGDGGGGVPGGAGAAAAPAGGAARAARASSGLAAILFTLRS
jgi:predicted DNA-binding WGR domain protein